ncbi:MAG: large conductance mechanosensitive channel protein MscL [Gemmataceae bacterium]|nr:large conductance mechanosensitive channel protein MscL [Gemmataceae bacterium]
MFDEFRQFAFKGNVIDLAVGVIIGAAFGKLVDSLVKNLFLPLISTMIPGEEGYAGWKWVIAGREIPYGVFLADTINFLLVSLAVFLFLVKFLGWMTRARKEDKPTPLSKQEELLTEIRDLLKQGTGATKA